MARGTILRGVEFAIENGVGSSVTLEDVARRAEVSPATVSRYINKPDSVREPKRRRVQAAIDALGYVRHGAARALASRRSRMIGAVFPSLDSTLFGDALESFQKELAKDGYTMVVASSEYDRDQEARHIRTLLENGVDALLLVGGDRPASVSRLLQTKGVPFVQTWISKAENGHPCVGFDNEAAAEDLTDYMVKLGHRRIAVISGPTEHNDRARARLNGIRARLRKADLSLPPDRIVETSFGMDAGRSAFNLLMRSDQPPTAVICGSEPFAYGALFQARSQGLRVPDDVSIAGFDDMWLAAQLTPALTTVRTPRVDMGREAARYLLARLAGGPVPEPRPLETRLIVRASTAPPPITAQKDETNG